MQCNPGSGLGSGAPGCGAHTRPLPQPSCSAARAASSESSALPRSAASPRGARHFEISNTNSRVSPFPKEKKELPQVLQWRTVLQAQLLLCSTQLLPAPQGRPGCGATAHLLPPAGSCPCQQPAWPAAALPAHVLMNPQTPEVRRGHRLTKGQSKHLLRSSPALKILTSCFGADGGAP